MVTWEWSGSRVPANSDVEAFATAVDGSYSLTVAVGASVLGIVGVLIRWEGGWYWLIIFIIIIIIIIAIIFFCVCVCVF